MAGSGAAVWGPTVGEVGPGVGWGGGRKGGDVCSVSAELAPVRRGLEGCVWELGTTADQARRPEAR